MNEVKIERPITYSGDKRFLVMARVGDSSLHKEWLPQSTDRNFDLFLEYYGDGSNDYRNDCDFYSEAKETKWPRLYQVMEEWGDCILEYDAIWIPDDDISVDCKTINEMFDLFMDYDLALAQPALTWDSYYSHDITLKVKGNILRYTNFVEVMVPIFSSEALELLWETFYESESGWGLDSIWPKLLGYSKDSIAIIDKVAVKHTRKVKSGSLYNVINRSPYEELEQICKEYNVYPYFDYSQYGEVHEEYRRRGAQRSYVFKSAYNK